MSRGRRAFLRALGILPASLPLLAGSARGQASRGFQVGWNHPWIAYGHDFGPAWGHDGLSTGGWTHETFPDTRGFTAARLVRDAGTGEGSLQITANLQGGDAARASGEVHLSLVDHWPFPCAAPDAQPSLNLEGALVRYRVRLPAGGAGPPAAPNGLQLVLKTRLADQRWATLIGRWQNILPAWEGRAVTVAAHVDAADGAFVDPGFDPSRVSLIGVKLGINAGSSATVRGHVHLEEFTVESRPPVTFDFEETAIDRDLRTVRDITGDAWPLVRIFVFCDGRASPSFFPDGSVAGLDSRFFDDFDALVAAAERHRVRLMPVLLDFGWCAPARTVDGLQLGGHAEVIRQPRLRQTFLDRALRPLVERYADRDAIWAWDLINEPEWAIRGLTPGAGPGDEQVSWSEMRAFAVDCVRCVRRFAPGQLVTIGSARRAWLPLWTYLGLDLYQFHWYGGAGDTSFPWPPYSGIGLDRPCIVGEVPTAGTHHTAADFIDAAAQGGYSGVLFWSYRARDAASDFCRLATG